MGLDMYLCGEKYLWKDFENPKMNKKENGFRVKSVTLDLGYWRKHPNLHGFIVQSFAKGVDECQQIELSEEAILTIIDAVKTKKLPHTEGFFFGRSDGSEDKATIKVFEKALKWLRTKEKNVMRSIYYRASW